MCSIAGLHLEFDSTYIAIVIFYCIRHAHLILWTILEQRSIVPVSIAYQSTRTTKFHLRKLLNLPSATCTFSIHLTIVSRDDKNQKLILSSHLRGWNWRLTDPRHALEYSYSYKVHIAVDSKPLYYVLITIRNSKDELSSFTRLVLLSSSKVDPNQRFVILPATTCGSPAVSHF